MSFYADNNRIQVTDTVGNLVFDTNRKMYAVTDIVVGTAAIGNKPVNQVYFASQSTVLAAINPVATFVMGHCQAVSTPATGGFPNIGTFNAGGSIVWGWQYFSPASTTKAFWTITFLAQGGQLTLREDWMNTESSTQPSQNITLVGGTFNYKIYCGTFV